MPVAPFFLTVCRFAPEKNRPPGRGVRPLSRPGRPRPFMGPGSCGDGPQAVLIDTAITRSGHAEAIHRPGFLQADALSRWYAHAGAFVLPSLSEPWGLVVNEAASTGLPLLVSNRAGSPPRGPRARGDHRCAVRSARHRRDVSEAHVVDFAHGRRTPVHGRTRRRNGEFMGP